MTVGSLFAGIGGFDLGFERAGYEIRWQVEIDPWARAVLAKHWPTVHRHDDVRTAGAHNLERVDLICGGFPCQDISLAGNGAGIEGERSGLWAEYARIIGELRPRYVVVENVAALLVRGFDRVLGDLAARGYDAEWDCIPAAAVGAPHRRDRIWLVAYAESGGQSVCGRAPGETGHASRSGEALADAHGERCLRGRESESAGEQGARRREPHGRGAVRQLEHATANDADTQRERLEGLIFAGAAPRPTDRSSLRRDSGWWETESAICRVVDGLPQGLDGVVDGDEEHSQEARAARGAGARQVRGVRGDGESVAPSRGLLTPEGCSGAVRAVPCGRRPEGRPQAHEAAEALRHLRHSVHAEALEEARHMQPRVFVRGGSQERLEAMGLAWSGGEWDGVPRIATGVAKRVDRLRGLGNAIVPQIAEWIARRILEADAEVRATACR